MTDTKTAPSAPAETAFARGALVLADGSAFEEHHGFGAPGWSRWAKSASTPP